MTAIEYYRKFTDLSRYHLDATANSIVMLCCFKLGTKKKWRVMAISTHCASYQEFYEILLRIEDSKNMSSDSDEEEEKNMNQGKDDKGKGQSSRGPRKTQSFKRSEASSSSSSGGFSATGQR